MKNVVGLSHNPGSKWMDHYYGTGGEVRTTTTVWEERLGERRWQSHLFFIRYSGEGIVRSGFGNLTVLGPHWIYKGVDSIGTWIYKGVKKKYRDLDLYRY